MVYLYFVPLAILYIVWAVLAIIDYKTGGGDCLVSFIFTHIALFIIVSIISAMVGLDILTK